MANLQEFINKHNGQHFDFDHGYGPQCVDVPKAWQAENGWPVMRGNAIQWSYPSHYAGMGYTFVRNGLHNKPDPGDVVVFKSGLYGHIGVCTSADYVNLTCFEQNNPIGSACRLVFHRFYGLHTSMPVLGWLKRS